MGSVYEFADVADLRAYGAVVAKSVSPTPWPGRTPPRLGSAGTGMLNGIGIQNPGVDAWVDEIAPLVSELPTRVWASVVGHTPDEFARVATAMARADIEAVEVNLSCPNLDGHLFALEPGASAEVVAAVRAAVDVPIGAKLSPNASDIAGVATAAVEAGADWLVLTNTALGAAIDIHRRRPVLSGTIGGYSGPPLKPIALRCVIEARRALPDTPIIGLGGVQRAEDVIEYLLAGASAVGIGTAHFADPRVASKVLDDLPALVQRLGAGSVSELVGRMETWEVMS